MKTSRFLFAAIGLLFLVLSGCGGILPDPGPDAVYPDLKVFAAGRVLPSGSTYDFGDVIVGESSATSFTLKNEGEGDLHLEETGSIVIIIRSVQAEAPFAVTSSISVIAAGESAPFSVTFNPTEQGETSTVVSISSDDPDGVYELTVVGEGVVEPEPEPWTLPDSESFHITGMDSDNLGNLYVVRRVEADRNHSSVVRFDEFGTIVWESSVDVGSGGWSYGIVASDDGSAVYHGYGVMYGGYIGEGHISRLDVHGEQVWDIVTSSASPRLLDPTHSYLYAGSKRYDVSDGSLAGTFEPGADDMGMVGGESHFYHSAYYSGKHIWVRRSYDLTTTYDWFWNPWDPDFVNDPPYGGTMVSGGDNALYGVRQYGVNYYELAEGERVWFLPINLTEEWQYANQFLRAAVSDSTGSLYAVYQVPVYMLDGTERHDRLLKVSAGGEVVWATEVADGDVELHVTGDTLFIGGEEQTLSRYDTSTGGIL